MALVEAAHFLYRPWEVLTDAPPSASRAAPVRQELPRPVLYQAWKVLTCGYILRSPTTAEGRAGAPHRSRLPKPGIKLRHYRISRSRLVEIDNQRLKPCPTDEWQQIPTSQHSPGAIPERVEGRLPHPHSALF